MSRIKFELTTPERIVVKDAVDGVTLPTQEGEITVLPGHIPLIAALVPGMVTLYKKAGEEYLAVSGGFIEVQPGNSLIVLADTAERAEELDLQKVEEARVRAAALLTVKRQADEVAGVAAVAALERELARVRVAKKHRTRRPATITQEELTR